MRSVSFAGLHRLLSAVAGSPKGLRANEIDKLVHKNGITLTRGNSPPARTTLYHYRNTLLQLQVLIRDGAVLRVNNNVPEVCQLLNQPAPQNGVYSLSQAARIPFSALVLRNRSCRSLFFDLFMPVGASSDSVVKFQNDGLPVTWSRHRSSNLRVVAFENKTTGNSAQCASRGSISAVLYGLRYWARDELGLIDEYLQSSDGRSVMFPVSWPNRLENHVDASALQTIRFLLSLRTTNQWTLFSIPDLILRCCQTRRQPRCVLFKAIDWLLREWPHHTVVIPTSHAIATMGSTSPQAEILELRRYYKSPGGPYISHIRLHKDITIESREELNSHVR